MQIKKVFFIISLCFAPFIESNQALWNAVQNNDYYKVKEILDRNDPSVDINITDNNGKTALIIACESENTQIAELLIANSKTDLNVKDNLANTPLILACCHNKTELATLLINNGADINATSSTAYTPLLWACYKNNLKLATLLINKGANINVKNHYNTTPLLRACQCNNLDLATLLINKGADINVTNNDNYTPLLWACYKNNLKLATLLILAGADKTAVTKQRDKNFLNKAIIRFAQTLRQWCLANDTERQTIPNHQKIQQAFNTIYNKANASNEEKTISALLQNGWDPILAIELGLSLQTTEITFAIKHFDEICAKYQTLMVNKF